LSVETLLCDTLRPIEQALPDSLLEYSGKVDVLKTDMSVLKHSPTHLLLRPESAVLVQKPPRRRSTAAEAEGAEASDGSEAFGIDVESDDDDFPNDADLWSAASSDAERQANDDGETTEEEPEASGGVPEQSQELDSRDGEEPADGPPLPRNPKGTHKVPWESPYFTLTHNPNYEEIRIRVKPTWLDDSGMGRAHALSRTLACSHFRTHEFPVRCSYIVLRAWALWRMQQNKFLDNAPKARTDAWRMECADLRREIRETDAASNENALTFLRQWAPECLP
ncbi:MAG: hypothetical protein GY725_18220, partial [bacterium]|nr:hypothetical protein [bacterium]